MSVTNNIDQQRSFKKSILDQCFHIQNERVNRAQEAVENAQESANEEESGIEEKFESFRTQMQQDRDMFAKQLNEALIGLNFLRKIELDREIDTVQLGAVVRTDAKQIFFLATNIGQLKHGTETVFVVSLESPIGKELLGKRVGDSIDFRGKKVALTEVF